jgi:hypothetical protein
VVPPGHEVVAGTVQECADGSFRPEWVQVAGNNTCKSCGDGFSSKPTDEITVYALTSDATPARMPVRTGGSACCKFCARVFWWETGGIEPRLMGLETWLGVKSRAAGVCACAGLKLGPGSYHTALL